MNSCSLAVIIVVLVACLFRGEKYDRIFATCVEKAYKRKFKTVGIHAWAAPVRPPPRL